MGLRDAIFGGTKQVSTLSPAQKALLTQVGGLQQQYNGNTYGTLNDIASNPTSAYEYDVDNGAEAFRLGVNNPALQQLNQQIGNNQHSSMLHSSANMFGQNRMKQDTMNNINNLQYQNMIEQQKLKQQGQTDAYGRQLSSLGQLMGGNGQVLGTQAVGLQKTGGLLDIMSGVGGLLKGIGSIK
jgi:hypothetical protein